jgi:hypothetical protein
MTADCFADPVIFNAELESARAEEAEVESDIEQLADAVAYVLKDRLDGDKAQYVARYEGRLLASLATLQLICSELREIRIKKAAA